MIEKKIRTELEWKSLKEFSRYLWDIILEYIDMPTDCLTEEATVCPVCKAGVFHFINEHGYGTFNCSICGIGDGFQLVALYKNIPVEDTYNMVGNGLDGWYEVLDYQRECALKDEWIRFWNNIIKICKVHSYSSFTYENPDECEWDVVKESLNLAKAQIQSWLGNQVSLEEQT